VILAGDPPPDAKAVDWDALEAEAAKEMPKVASYTMSWDCPRSSKWEAKTSFSPKNQPNPATPPG
jgi:hypothetical protein